MEALDEVALFDTEDGACLGVLFAREGLCESVGLSGLVDPDTLVEDLKGDDAPLFANLHDGMLLSDGAEIVLQTDICIRMRVGKVEERYLVCVCCFCREIDGSEAGIVFCGETEYLKPYFWG